MSVCRAILSSNPRLNNELISRTFGHQEMPANHPTDWGREPKILIQATDHQYVYHFMSTRYLWWKLCIHAPHSSHQIMEGQCASQPKCMPNSKCRLRSHNSTPRWPLGTDKTAVEGKKHDWEWAQNILSPVEQCEQTSWTKRQGFFSCLNEVGPRESLTWKHEHTCSFSTPKHKAPPFSQNLNFLKTSVPCQTNLKMGHYTWPLGPLAISTPLAFVRSGGCKTLQKCRWV